MQKVLESGMHLSIYPEGTRNRTEAPLKEFYPGAFKLAVETKTSIIPCLMFNTKKAVPPNKGFYFLPKRLRMEYLAPISPIGLTAEELKQKVFDTMEAFYISNQDPIDH